MIIEKSHDTDIMKQELFDSINCALESSDPIGLWVQKYQDNCEDYWEVSVTDNSVGIHILNNNEIANFIAAINYFNESEDFSLLNSIILNIVNLVIERWNDNKTIDITTTTYCDYYDMYGVSRSDFI